MSYAMVIDGVIVTEQDQLPSSAKRLDTGLWEHPGTTWTPELAAEFGYYQIVETERPTDTADVTHTRTVELVDGTPTVVWTARAWTEPEQSGRISYANEATLRSQADQARDANAAFLAIPAPTAAQVLAQVRLLTRQANGLIRLALDLYDGTD